MVSEKLLTAKNKKQGNRHETFPKSETLIMLTPRSAGKNNNNNKKRDNRSHKINF